MPVKSCLRNLSFGLATTTLVFAGSALAQQSSQQSSQGTYKLVGVDAKLDHSLSSKNAKPGEPIAAKLQSSAQTTNGTDLPKGTELCGKVLSAQAAQGSSPARVSVLFNQAKLKNGTTVPVHVILLGAFPAASGMQSDYAVNEMGPAPKSVPSNEKVDQKPGILHHVAMHSDMHGQDSATFIDRHGDFTLHAGTRLQLGIAPGANAIMNSGM